MKRSLLRNASLLSVGTLLFLILPASSAFAIHNVSGVAPNALGRGATFTVITVSGTGFLPTATVTFSGTGITKNSQTVNGSTSITVNVSITSTATLGAHNVTVDNGPVPGTDVDTCTACFSVNAAPVAISLSPSALGQGASQSVTITGTGFTSGVTASVSGTGVTVGSPAFVNATTMTANFVVSSSATTGTRDVTVTNTDGGKSTCAACLTVDSGPTVTLVSPAAANNGDPSVLLTITGSHFVSGATVRIHNAAQSDITGSPTVFVSATSLKASVDLTIAAPGSWDVIVTNPDHGTVTCAACFSVGGSPPTAISLNPSALGRGASAVDVTITGTHFANGAVVTVSGTGVTAGTVTVSSPTSLVVSLSVSGSAAMSPRDVTVTNTDAQAGICSGCLMIDPGTTATSVLPTSRGQGATNEDFAITGTGFVSGATVSFSGTGISVGTVSVDSDTAISTTISISPTAVVGARDVIVTNPDHGVGTCSGCFTVNTAPVVTSLDPNALGQGVTSQDIAVTGTHFVNGVGLTISFSGTGVTVNGTPTFNSSTSLTVNVTVASDATVGARNVTATNPDHGTSTCSACFTVNGSPTITSAVPDHLGQGAASQVVALTGTGFVNGSVVTATSGTGLTIDTVSFVDATHLNATMTVGSSASVGYHTLKVTNPDGGFGSCTTCFSVTAKPFATSAVPGTLGQGASHTVTLHGSGFATGVGVVVSGTGVSVANVAVTDSATLTMDVTVTPTATANARDITLTNTDHGTATCTGCLTISNGPTIDTGGVSPSLAANSGSTLLTISGSNFADTPTVILRRASQQDIVASVQFVSSSSVKATVDLALAAPGSWNVVLTNPDFGSTTCSGCLLVTASAPTVTSANPSTLGQGATNQDVDITGTNFANGAQVAFSGAGITVGIVVVNSSTSITATISISGSAAIGARDITVTNTDDQSGTCPGCFTVASAPTASSISPAQRGAGLTGQALSITGTGFTAGTTVGFSGTGITVTLVTFNSSSSLTVNVDIAGGATLGVRDVTFQNDDTSNSTCIGCFHVTGPTSVSLTAPSSLAGSITVTFSQPVGGVSSSNVFFRVTGTATTLGASLTCADSASHITSCSSGSVKSAALRPSSTLTPGQYYTVSVSPAGSPITDFGGLTVPPSTPAFRASTLEQAESSTAETCAWRTVSNANAFGGSYTVDHLSGAKASFTFTGTAITWYTNTGPNYGVSDVYVDGVVKVRINAYASSPHYHGAVTISGLSAHSHTIAIVVKGLKGSTSGTGTDVAVDAFKVGSTLYSTPAARYGWQQINTPSASGGAYIRSDTAWSRTAFSFRSTRVDWYTVAGPTMGIARVYIDGVLKATVDNYASTYGFNIRRTFAGLSDTKHTITIVVLGTHRAASKGSFVAIDRWVLL